MVVVTAATTLLSSFFFVSCSFFFSLPRLLFSLYTIKVHMLTKSGIKEVTDIANLHPLLLQNAASGPWPNEPPSIPIDNESPVKTCFFPKK